MINYIKYPPGVNGKAGLMGIKGVYSIDKDIKLNIIINYH